MEYVPPETFVWLASSLMPNLNRGSSENRMMRRFRSFFGVTPDLCTDLWGLACDSLIPTCLPMHFLWTFMFLKQCRTEEQNASIAGCDEDTFRRWVWYVLSVVPDLGVASDVLFVFVTLHLFFVRLILTIDAWIVTEAHA